MMASIDLALDEIVKKIGAGKRRGGRGFKNPNAVNQRGRIGNKKFGRKFRGRRGPLPDKWKRGDALIQSDIKSSRLLISNLDHGVTDEDIHDLFSVCGPLKKTSLNYDSTGKSNGTAEVVYLNVQSAQSAISEYNGVKLDGRPLRIQMISPLGSTALSKIERPRNLNVGPRKQPFQRRFGRKPFANKGGPKGVFKRRFGNKVTQPKTKEELDAEMINYYNVTKKL